MSFIEALKKYVPYDAKDEEVKRFILDAHEKCGSGIFARDAKVHMCASCWVVNPLRTKVLMAHHDIYKSFAWMGGHADGCGNLTYVARKELGEESGIKNFKMLVPGIFMLFALPVSAHLRKSVPVKKHSHIGAVYLFEASEDESIRPRKGENSRVEWIPLEKIPEVVAQSDAHMLPFYARLNEKVKGLGI